MANFNQWLDTFLQEKGYDLEQSFEVSGPSGLNHMSYTIVVEHMKIAPEKEQKQIKDMMVKIDFRNGDVLHFMRHLAQAIAI